MLFYCNYYDMDIVMARTFNLYGKGISKRLFIGKIYSAIDKYKNKEIHNIKIGNLNHRRDYISIEKAVQYYKKIMDHGISGNIYNVGSGKPITMRNFLHNILLKNDIDTKIVEESEKYYHDKVEIEEIYADIEKIRSLK